MRTQTLNPDSWSKFVTGEFVESHNEETQADLLIAQHVFKRKARQALERLELIASNTGKADDEHLALLTRRWLQTLQLIRQAYLNSIQAAVQQELGPRFLDDL